MTQPSDSRTWEAKAGSSLVQDLPKYMGEKKNLISRSNKRQAGEVPQLRLLHALPDQSFTPNTHISCGSHPLVTNVNYNFMGTLYSWYRFTQKHKHIK